MLFDFAAMTPPDRYKILATTIIPRPIAWVVTRGAEGRVNAAPFSFFNVFGDDPPILCIGIGGLAGGGYKDSGANIRATGQLVVNLVSEALMQAMHVTAIDFAPGVEELAEAGLTTAPSAFVAPPRIAESPVAFECETHSLIEFGNDRTMVVARVLAAHVHDDAVLNAARFHLDAPKLQLVGRVHGPGGYIRVSGPGVFQLARLKLQEWVRRT